jgi:hypothetical protein
MLRLADLQRKIDEAAEEMRHLTEEDQDRRPITGSFSKRIHTMMVNGMVIFIMAILLLIMLLLWQQICRLPLGPHHTCHFSFLRMMGIQTLSSF